MVSTYDESQGKFGEDVKLATWINRTVNIGRITILTNGLTLEECEGRFVKF